MTFLLAQIPRGRDVFRVGISSFGAKVNCLGRAQTVTTTARNTLRAPRGIDLR
jgi:hypothetical protein